MTRNITRRRALGLLGAGTATTITADPVVARNRARVFVHPNGGQQRAIDALADHGGRARFVYDSLSFVAGTVPHNRRAQLARDGRIRLVERDHRASLVEPVARIVHHKPGHDRGGGGNGGGGNDDTSDPCADHPEERIPWGISQIGADGASTDGSGVGVGIIDTGIDGDHCDLRANVAGGHNCTQTGPARDWDDRDGHGTHVAGTVAAANNDIGVRGVAPNADLYGLRVKDNSGAIYYSYVVCAIDWCVSNGVPVMNISLGGPASQSVGDAIDRASAKGHFIAAAAGNESTNQEAKACQNNVIFPASHPRVMAVSAMERDRDIADFSSTGDAPAGNELQDDSQNDIDIIAPGGGDADEDGTYETPDDYVLSTYSENRYAWAAGTSMASPHVAGAAALVWDSLGLGAPGSGDGDEVWSRLTGTADDIGLSACKQGAGLVDADGAT